MRGSPISKPIRPSAQNFHHSSLHHSHSPPSPVPRQRSFHTPPPAIKDIENKSRLTKKDETKEKRKEKKEKNSDGRPSYPNQKQIPKGPGTGSTTNVTAEVGGRGGREKEENKIMEDEDEDDTDEDFEGTLRRLLPSTSASTSVIKASESGTSTPRPQTLKLKLKLPPGAQAQVRKPSAEKKVASPGGGKVKTTKVLRKFKRRDTADEMDTDGEESSLSEVKSVGDGKEGEDAKGYYESSEGEDSEEETTEVVVITELPPHPGKAPEEGGVVTWSDYELEDFVDGGWAIEVSSPELKGVDDEMWFSKLDSQGPSEAEDSDHPLLVIDSWNGLDTTEDDRANSDLLSEDDGETTDSLDEDDHVALVRFGIEVEEPPTEPLLPMTTSLAELELSGQPSPDEAMSPPSASDKNQAAPHSLPAELSATISMEALATDPEKVLTEAAKSLGVDLETAASILTGVGMSVIFTHEGGSPPSSKRKLRHKRKKKEGQERSLRKLTAKNLTETDAPSEPVMGTFLIHSDSGRSVIDGKKPPASPFSRKPGSVRPSRANSSERNRTPLASRRRMSDTSVTSAGPSYPPTNAFGSPFNFQPMVLDDVLDDSAPFSDTQDGVETPLALSRWDRVPIGAFRNQTTRNSGYPLSMDFFSSPMVTGPTSSSSNGHRERSNSLLPPVLLPMFGQEETSVKSRRARRKEKKSKSTISRSQSLKEPYRVRSPSRGRDRSHSAAGAHGTGPIELSEKNLQTLVEGTPHLQSLPLPSAHLPALDDTLFKEVSLGLASAHMDLSGDVMMNEL